MKLKVSGKDGKPIKKIAVMVNPDIDQSEVIVVDEIAITVFVVSFINGIVRAEFRLGGRDSKGNFHIDYSIQPALWGVNVRIAEERVLFDQHFKGKRKFDFDDLTRLMHSQLAVQRAGRTAWDMPEIEATLEE